MSDFPNAITLDLNSGRSVLSTAMSQAGLNQNVAPASTAWPAANLAIFVPVRLPVSAIVYRLVVGAGSTAAGNFDVGIYDSAGNRLVSSGATAKGASVEQIIDVSDTMLGPGIYYLAMSADGTNNYSMITPSGTSPIPLQKTRLSGVMNVGSAYTLPASVTYAAATNVAFPVIAAYLKAYG